MSTLTPLPRQPAHAGGLVGGRYRLIEIIGAGGMGTVWKAHREDVGTDVAVKILKPELADSAEAVTRFEREAHAAARLAHPGCVAVLDYGQDAGSFFLALELVEGEHLGDHLARGPMSSAEVIAVADGILAALDHAHAAGVVHRDIKPHNVMLLPDGSIKLLDFGVARLVDVEVDPAVRHATAAGIVVGTPQYLSPEQALGEPGDARSDLYAVGILLWEMLVGRPPFSGATQREILAAQICHDPMPPSVAAPGAGISATLDAVTLRALSKSPGERYASAAELRRALAEAAADLSPARPWTQPGHASLLPPGRPTGFRFTAWPPLYRGVALAVALVILLAAGSGVYALATREPPPPRGLFAHHTAESAEIARVRAALGRGDLPAAEHGAEELVADNPDDPRAFLWLGHAMFAARDKTRGLAAYREAVRLDRTAVDAELLANLRATFADRAVSEEAFALAERVGAEAVPALVDFVKDTRDSRLKARAQRARDAAKRLEERQAKK
jgi:tRNA A-37 threonylcarbamoyl transferase component Bud32/tetratricopeptide (TPR) repeat protein